MTATDELRKLLTECGVEWRSDSENITFWNTDADVAAASQGYDGMLWVSARLTPEQAIAATLGGGKLTAEQVREAIEENSWKEAFMILEFNDSSWQAIADELNATLGAGTCHNLMEPGYNYFRCSECDANTYCEEEDFNYCPNCGAKVVSE